MTMGQGMSVWDDGGSHFKTNYTKVSLLKELPAFLAAKSGR